MKKTILFFSLIGILTGCNTNSEDSEIKKQNELLKKELELKERELALKEKELSSNAKDSVKSIDKSSLNEIYKEVNSAVFLIYVYGEQNSFGSGFLIDKSGLAVTNYHVLENADQAVVELSDGSRELITDLVKISKENDYVVFRIGNGTKDYPYVDIANELPEIGEDCFAIGNPNGRIRTLSTGIVSNYHRNNKFIQTTAEITHGSSGGPLFNSLGKVIGITQSGDGEANLNFAINIHLIRENIYTYVNNETQYSVDDFNSGSIDDTDKEFLEERITKFYGYLKNSDYSMLKLFFADNLKRYYNNFDLNPDMAIHLIKNKKTGDYIDYYYNLQNTSIDVYRTRWGYAVFYKLQGGFVNKNTGVPTTLTIDVCAEFDSELKIISLYELKK